MYYADERINVNYDDFDYLDVYYKYLPGITEDWDIGSDTFDATTAHNAIHTATSIGTRNGYAAGVTDNGTLRTIGDNIYVLREDGIFVNRLQADVRISGQKIWANVPEGFLEADLVPVQFKLYQFNEAKGDEIPTDQISVDEIENPDGKYQKSSYAFIDISNWSSQRNSKGLYRFELQYKGENANFVNEDDSITVSLITKDENEKIIANPVDTTKIPKYDDAGNIYTYILREAGDFSGSDAERNTNLVFKQPSLNDFAITNTYSSQMGELSVRKILDISEFKNLNELGKIPAVTFTLTRAYEATDAKDAIGNPAIIRDDAFSREITLNADGFAKGKVEGQDNVFVQEGKFEDLEIYAPNGNKYVYTITENPKLDNGSHLIQGGYEAYGANGWHELEVSQHLYPDRGDLNAYSISGLYPKYVEKTDNPVTAVINGIGDFFTGIGEFLGITEQQNPSADDTSWVTFKNVYNKEEAPLEFGKIWEDNGQSNGRFTTPLKFEVRQWADTQPGQNNAIGTKDTLMGTFTITLKENPDGQPSVKDQSKVTLTKNDLKYGSIAVKCAENQDKPENILNHIDSVTVYVDNPDPANPQTLGNNKNWKIKIEGFQTYAPNGMPWRYQLKEVDAYPYIITNETMEFRYDGTTSTFVRTNGSNVLTNTSRITVTGTKNITTAAAPDGDYADNSQTVWNYTGFDVRVNFDVYATFVKANSWGDAMAEMLKEPSNGAQTNTAWVNLRTDTDATYRQDLVYAMNEYEESKDPGFTASTVFPNIEKDENTPSFGKQSASYKNLPRVFDTADGTVYASYILLETSIELIIYVCFLTRIIFVIFSNPYIR